MAVADAAKSGMSPTEIAVLGELLESLVPVFNDKSCTEYVLDPTDDYKAVAAHSVEHFARTQEWGDENVTWEEFVAQIMQDDEQVVVFIDWMSQYLAFRCQSFVAGTGPTLSAAEIDIAAEMLDQAIVDHEEYAENGVEPMMMDASESMRTLVPGAITAEGQIEVPALLAHFEKRLQEIIGNR